MKITYGSALFLSAIGIGLNTSAEAQTYKLIHSFQANGSTDGANPSGLMAYVNSRLYGTTQSGGPAGDGTVFRLNPKTGKESPLYAFKGGSDGYSPSRDVVAHDGVLYGTTAFGGQPPINDLNETGTIFSIDLKTGTKTILFEFPNDGSLGYAPGDIKLVNGVLYGTTAGGQDPEGATYYGTLFSFNLSTGVFTNLRTFDPGDRLDGGFPLAGLTQVGENLYGTTREGGNGSGSIFGYNIKTGTFTVLCSLGVTHGFPTQPESTPVYLDGSLYITSATGGLSSNYYGYGTVFKFDLKTQEGTVLYSFQNGADGEEPLGGLVYENGLLYGTTVVGGANGGGVLFSIDPKTGQEVNLYSFGAQYDASEPNAALTDVRGTLFGTTFYGGTENAGAIFEYTP